MDTQSIDDSPRIWDLLELIFDGPFTQKVFEQRLTKAELLGNLAHRFQECYHFGYDKGYYEHEVSRAESFLPDVGEPTQMTPAQVLALANAVSWLGTALGSQEGFRDDCDDVDYDENHLLNDYLEQFIVPLGRPVK